MARIAMFLARAPGPPMTGRKAVIRTAISALAQEGHEIDLFVLAKRADGVPREARATHWLGTPSRAAILCNAGRSVLGGGFSLNEALFRSGTLLARVRRHRHAYDFAIADTIRAAPYAEALGVPWHLDLDDLFSARYAKYLEQPDQLSASLVLGYYRASAPRAAAAMPGFLLRCLLRREAACLTKREAYWAARAGTVSLVSPDEAQAFSSTAGREVYSLPMSVAVPAERWRPGGEGGAFLGGLDYKPNLDALLYYQREIFPLLKAAGAPPLSHIGNAPVELRAQFAAEAVRFDGYVTDVAPRLGAAAFFLAPIVSGTGIKTKVLEAMALGLPVLASPHAVAGLAVEHREHCFICERPAAFLEGMRYVRTAAAAESMGRKARAYVRANFSMDVLRGRWSAVVRNLARRNACSTP